MNDSHQKICTNIYMCKEAAKLRDAKSIPNFNDKCNTCGSRITYPAFMKLFVICACPICSRLTFQKSEAPMTTEQIINCRKKMIEPYCILCGCEYKSLEEKEDAWIKKAGEVLEIFLGIPEIAELSQKLYRMCEKIGCPELSALLKELLSFMSEEKKSVLEKRIKKSEKYLGMQLLNTQ